MRLLVLFLLVAAVPLALAGTATWRADPFGEFYGHRTLQAADGEAAMRLPLRSG